MLPKVRGPRLRKGKPHEIDLKERKTFSKGKTDFFFFYNKHTEFLFQKHGRTLSEWALVRSEDEPV